MAAATFHYAERQPVTELRGWLLNYWGFEVRTDGPTPPPHHVPPDGCTSLAVVCLPEGPVHVSVSGPWVDPLVVNARPGSRYWGCRCRTDTGGLLFGCDPGRLVNRVQPAEPLLGALAVRLGQELAAVRDIDAAAAVMNRLLPPPCPNPSRARPAGAYDRDPAVGLGWRRAGGVAGAVGQGAEKVMFDAFAVIYRDREGKPALRAYLANGQWVDATLEVKEKGLVWGWS
jgi:hypothetical protein